MNEHNDAFQLMPPQASQLAGPLDLLFWAEVGLITLVVGGVLVLMIVFAYRYREGRERDRSALPRGRRARNLEIAWSIVPLLIFLGLFVWGTQLYVRMGDPPADALHIHGVGKQWMWKFQHPDGQREINELHLPRGRPVRLTLVSQDVIHSFFVPAFRVKQDAVPGMYTQIWFEPTRTGSYHLFCAEYCGTAHSRMRGRVVVMEPERYAQWLAAQQPSNDLAQQGAGLFRRLGCSGCHSAKSHVHAPSLVGLFGRSVPLADGSRRRVDEGYLRDSILLPEKDVVAGYQPIMPSFKGQLSESELFQLITYLKQLEEETP